MFSVRRLARPGIWKVRVYEGGKPIEELRRERGLARIIKLASNENPLGPSPKAVRAMRRALRQAHRYPDGSGFALRRSLARHLGVKPTEIALGNGSNELIELVARAFLVPGDEIVTARPSFLVYPLLAQIMGHRLREAPLRDLRYHLTALRRLVNRHTKLIFIANPNNPTGTYVTHLELVTFLNSLPRRAITVLDEAYFEFADAKDFPHILSLRHRHPLLTLRTFSKAYGLAGLRIGYGVSSHELVGALERVRQPFNTNALAQVAATAALGDSTFLRKTQKTVWEGRNFLYREFRRLGLSYTPTQANFVLVDVARPARGVFEALLRRGIIVRDMSAYGLHRHIRITIGRMSDNRRLILELKNVL